VGEDTNHTPARKPGPLQIIQYSVCAPMAVARAERVAEV
jgi:hypothetical protein